MSMSNRKKAYNRRKEALKRICLGVNSFNEWRNEFPTMYIDLSDYDFSGTDLSNINFSGVKLKNTNFTNCILHNAKFCGSNLNNSDLSNSNCTSADFKQARLLNTNFSNSNINNLNLYSTARGNTIFNNVVCNQCWITKNRDEYPNEPEKYQPGEFELIHGGRRFKIYFKSGMEPIDLLALPYYSHMILEHFKDYKLIFTGLSTVGDAGLEFRVEPNQDINVKHNIQKYMDENVDFVRTQLIEFYKYRVEELKVEIERKDRLIYEKDSFIHSVTEKLLESNNKYYISNYNMTIGALDKEELKLILEEIKKIKSSINLEKDKLHVLNEIEIAASNGEESKVKRIIGKSGKLLFDLGKQVGASILTEYAKKCLL